LLEGAASQSAALDELITRNADNWKFERLSAIDRAILRLGIYELRFTDTPHKVVMNECVELAKKFSSEDAGSFVNGILDAVYKKATMKSGSAVASMPRDQAAAKADE
jgi:N utilization substance protein B